MMGDREKIELGLRAFLKENDLLKFISLSFREFDFYLRLSPREPVLSPGDLSCFEKEFLCIQKEIFLNLSKKLTLSKTEQEALYRLALVFICEKYNLPLRKIEMVEIEKDLITLRLEDSLEEKARLLEVISDGFSEIFKNDSINIIPE